MYTTKKIAERRDAFTLVEMLVVIAIILALAALAAAFAPRVSDNQKMTRAVDNLEQYLLIAKMRAKRDGLSTGIRFIPDPTDISPTNPHLSLSSTYTQFQYIQQPAPLAGGVSVPGPPLPLPLGGYAYTNPITLKTNYYTGGLITSAGFLIDGVTPAPGQVNFAIGSVDFSLGGLPALDLLGRQQWLVQTGDFLEINGGGVYLIASATSLVTLQLGATQYDKLLTIPVLTPTTNYRIIRQPRILIGEQPLTLPSNYAVNFGPIPGTVVNGSNVAPGASGYLEILFSPTGAVVGSNAGSSTIVMSVWDTTAQPFDPNNVGVVGIQSRTGFMGAYGLALGSNPFYFVQSARESGM